jgi:dihydroxyacetone kinase-like protein
MEQQLAGLLPALIESVRAAIDASADAVTALDQAIGDGDHLFNLQRGLDALQSEAGNLARLAWPAALEKVGMTLLSTMGGASGSLYGTLFIALGKGVRDRAMCLESFTAGFDQAVAAVKARGKADLGDKTMLDVLIPVARALQLAVVERPTLEQALTAVNASADEGVESTRDLIASKGRASFLGEKARGHLDPGAKTSQIMIGAIANVLRTVPH